MFTGKRVRESKSDEMVCTSYLASTAANMVTRGSAVHNAGRLRAKTQSGVPCPVSLAATYIWASKRLEGEKQSLDSMNRRPDSGVTVRSPYNVT